MKLKRIGASINEEIWNSFREDVKEKEGRLSGVLSQQLEKALVYYMTDGKTDNCKTFLTHDEDERDISSQKNNSFFSDNNDLKREVEDTNRKYGMDQTAQEVIHEYGEGCVISPQLIMPVMMKTEHRSSSTALQSRVNYMVNQGYAEWDDNKECLILKNSNLGF